MPPTSLEIYVLRAPCIRHVLCNLRNLWICRNPYSLCDLYIRWDSQRNLGTGDLGDHASPFLCSRDAPYGLGNSHDPVYTTDQSDSWGPCNSYHVWEGSQRLARL